MGEIIIRLVIKFYKNHLLRGSTPPVFRAEVLLTTLVERRVYETESRDGQHMAFSGTDNRISDCLLYWAARHDF